MMLGGFAKIAHQGFGTICREMTMLFAVETGYGVTRAGEMPGLVAVSTGSRLTIITKVKLYFAKTEEIRYWILDTDAKVANAVLHIFPSRLSEITSTVVKNVTILGKASNNGGVWHLMRCVENLKVCQRAIHILQGERLPSDLQGAFCQEILFEGIGPEGEDNFSRTLTLDAGNVAAIHASIFQGIKNFDRWDSSSRVNKDS